MTRITHLKLLDGSDLCSWYDPTRRVDVFPDAREAVADWGNCELDEVDYTDTEGGEFFTIDGVPVAYIEVRWSRPAKVSPFPATLMAAE